MHSPWGIIYQIVKETGWSMHYVLWKVSKANLMLMMADRSRTKYGTKEDQEEAIEGTKADLLKQIKGM